MAIGANSDAPPGPAQSGPSLIGGRYQRLNRISLGGMGVVYRALDRLTGQVVALKLVGSKSTSLSGLTAEAERISRLALAREFKIMASLRHPNILGVIDYGFDAEHGPYLISELLERAQSIVEVARGKAKSVQVNLLVQLLRAVSHLHTRSIIHRDLKPANVLVANGVVRVLDFGIAMLIEQPGEGSEAGGGTLEYLAPELLRKTSRPSQASDMWAVGVIAYEIFFGFHPFSASTRAECRARIISDQADIWVSSSDVRLAPVIGRMLVKKPEQRISSAAQAIEEISAVLQQDLTGNTPEVREAVLQAPPFVGREGEFRALLERLSEAEKGQGSAWLLGGESGVGKSRIAEELRIEALVRGVMVLRGQSVSAGGRPYQLWRDVLRMLALSTEMSDFECGVLRSVVPDISELLDRKIPAPPPVDETVTQTRALSTIEDMFLRQERTILLVLEDLHWAGSESIRLLLWLSRIIGRAPLLIVGTFRNDEAPTLPELLGDMQMMGIRRLSPDAIAKIATSILGTRGAEAQTLKLLLEESEGNPFFAIEALRSLVEGAESGAGTESEALASAGVRRLLQRRLARLSAELRQLMRVAAVGGRRVDPRIMERFVDPAELEQKLTECARAGVLDASGAEWIFSHDKFREALCEEIDVHQRRSLHRSIAEAIEAVYADSGAHLSALAHHWSEANDDERAGYFAQRAGEQALSSGACAEAVAFLERALSVASTEPAGASRVALIQFLLMEARFRLGELERTRSLAEAALALAGDPMPRGGAGWWLGIAAELCTRLVQAVFSPRPRTLTREESEALSRSARVHLVLSEIYMYSLDTFELVLATVRLANRCTPAGASPHLARAHLALGIMLSTTPFRHAAERFVRGAIAMSDQTGGEYDRAYVTNRAAVFDINCGNWDIARERINASLEIARKYRDQRLVEECSAMLGMVAFYQSRFSEAEQYWVEAYESANRSGNSQIRRWGLFGRADALLRLGCESEACELYDRALDGKGETASELVWGRGMRSLALLRRGETERAYAEAVAVLEVLDCKKPCAYWTSHGAAAAAEVMLHRIRSNSASDGAGLKRAKRAVVHLHAIARIVPMAAPQALVRHGELLRLTGSRRAAARVWRKSVEVARQRGMRFESGLAHLHLGLLDSTHAEDSLVRAREIFQELGTEHELITVRRLGESRDFHESL